MNWAESFEGSEGRLTIRAAMQSRVRWYLNFVLDNFDVWLLPSVLLVAWFYYPYCQEGPNLCIWKALLHRRCPGCGLTRAICFMVHGRVREALDFNPLSVLALGLMTVNFSKAARSASRAFLTTGSRASSARNVGGATA